MAMAMAMACTAALLPTSHVCAAPVCRSRCLVPTASASAHPGSVRDGASLACSASPEVQGTAAAGVGRSAASALLLFAAEDSQAADGGDIFSKYFKREKLDPLDTYVPTGMLAQLQFQDVDGKLGGEEPEFSDARSLLGSGLAGSLRTDIRAVAQYAAEAGNGETANDAVDQCLSDWHNRHDVIGVGEVDEHEDEGVNIFRSIAHAATLGREILSAVERTDLDEEMLDEEDRITGALRIGLVGCRRSASWICFAGGARPRRKRAWKTTNKKGSIAKARKLVDIISEVPSAKEEIYGALDAFVAWELEFPIIAIKKALQLMAEAQQWKRVIQVTKWMLSKGQARTLGTYTLLLQALDYEGRVEEADALWEKLLTENEDATPRIMFTVVIAMFDRHNQLKRLLQVFADMEELEVKPDIVTVERVARAYRSLGLMKRADLVEAKYPPTQWAWRYSKRGKKYRIRVTADDHIIKPEKSSESESEADEDGEEDNVGDSDSEHDEFVFEEESVGEKPTLLNYDSILPSVGFRP